MQKTGDGDIGLRIRDSIQFPHLHLVFVGGDAAFPLCARSLLTTREKRGERL
jgi:hypothetical protein